MSVNPKSEVFFLVAHMTPLEEAIGFGGSAAGNQVQLQIFAELFDYCLPDNNFLVAMRSAPAWPRGPLLIKSKKSKNTEFVGYINIAVIKHLVFGIRLFKRMLQKAPTIVIQYNSYAFENVAVLFYQRLDVRRRIAALLIQDIHIESNLNIFSKKFLRSFGERLGLSLARRFNLIIPISSAIIDDFKLSPKKCFVFQGGVTDLAKKTTSEVHIALEDYAVFAGALEPHNGIDKLVDRWVCDGISKKLHIFGRGSLSAQIEEISKKSDFVVFHGYSSEEKVLDWQKKARWNFCLRYSVGLDQRYFFPSKLFSILCARGAVMVNDFYALPSSIRPYLFVVSDDLQDLASQLDIASKFNTESFANLRREVVLHTHSWKNCINKLVDFASNTRNF